MGIAADDKRVGDSSHEAFESHRVTTMSENVKEISLRDIIHVGIRRRRLILRTAACAFVLALLYAIFATPYYKATVTVQPNIESSSPLGSLGQLADQMGSLSSLVGSGMQLGGDAEAKQQNYMAVLSSQGLALKFINQYNLMPKLFPGRWNPVSHQWRALDPSTLSRVRLALSRAVARISGDQGWRPPSSQPTAWQALKAFDRICTIKSDRATGMVKVSFELQNPEESAEWANEFMALANAEIRDRIIAQSTLALKYLNDQAANTNVTELKAAIYTLVQQRLEEIVSAKSRPDYAFQIIDQAMVPAVRSSPQRVLIIVLATLIAGSGALIFAVVEAFGGLRPKATREW
jgi:uncharacterized protein involved in exopolysaccharide biosynthesis